MPTVKNKIHAHGLQRVYPALTAFLLAVQAVPALAASIPLSNLGTAAAQQRWLDVADYPYGTSYRAGYDYDQGVVHVVFTPADSLFRGTLVASNLKPNFTYQLKVQGIPGTDANERIGLSGRWWQEEWNGASWSSGQNLNNKGDGSSPNPNDLVYFQRRDIPDPFGTSPSGLRYRYTGYRVFEYFTTDSVGNAFLGFTMTSSYHVLWKTTQRAPTGEDGPPKPHPFAPDPALQPAYESAFPETTVTVFGEWERLTAGGITLLPGSYTCELVLTEESFHGSGGPDAGSWASAMGAQVEFLILADATSVAAPDPASFPRLKLLPASPNPFRRTTSIRLEVPGTGALHVLDVTGRLVTVLVPSLPSGPQQVDWDGGDTAGHNTAPGVYFIVLTAPGAPPATQAVVRLP
jgi:hypothetical protein